MPILGTLVDRLTVSRAGDAGTTSQRVALTTQPHSLPATNPEAIFINLRSIEAVTGVPVMPLQVFGLAGNASLATIGTSFFPGVSGVSAPTYLYDVVCVVFHSIVR